MNAGSSDDDAKLLAGFFSPPPSDFQPRFSGQRGSIFRLNGEEKRRKKGHSAFQKAVLHDADAGRSRSRAKGVTVFGRGDRLDGEDLPRRAVARRSRGLIARPRAGDGRPGGRPGRGPLFSLSQTSPPPKRTRRRPRA